MAIMKHLICFALMALIACHRKTETKEITNTIVQQVEKNQTWQRESVFSYEFASNQNSFLFKGNLFCVNDNYYVSRLDSTGAFMYGAPTYYDPNYPVGSDYANTFSVGNVLVFLHEGIGFNNGTRIDIELRNDLRDYNSFKRIIIDSSNLKGFKGLLNPYSYRTNKFVSDAGFAIIPASFDSLNSGNHDFLLLKNLNLDDSVFSYKDVSKLAQRISFKGGARENSFGDNIYVIDSNIFISSFNNGLYRLDASGNIQRINDLAFNGSMFKFNGKLYAGVYGLYESTDNGSTWKNLGNDTDYGVAFRSFIINKTPYFLLGSGINYGTGITRIASNAFGNLYYEVLDTDGLENNQITSLTLFKDKLYATTLSGVYSTDFKSLKVKQ
jgi:hypothetical protein